MKEALHQHVKRAAFQAGHIWGQSQIPKPEVPSPHQWEWVKSDKDGWQPFWTVMPEASKGCHQLIRCKCKNTALETANVSWQTCLAQNYAFAQDNAFRNSTE